MFAPALPGFPTNQRQQPPRMRLSLKESRIKLLNAIDLDTKSGIHGPENEIFQMLSLAEMRRC
jgi:hypothetical protein